MRIGIVTGAGTGIGAACAVALAGTCERLVLLGRRAGRLEEVAEGIRAGSTGTVVDTRSVDLTDVDAVAAFGDWARTELDHVDVLVNNAGSPQPPAGEGLRGLAEAWEATWRGNTLSAVLLTEGLKDLIGRPGGRIVTIGSIASEHGTGSASYSSAKGALVAYTRSLARELGPAGVTANLVAPGYTQGTELLAGRVTPERHERLISGTSARRAGQPDEIAAVVAFLASPAAGYVNGQVIEANGGTFVPA